MDKGYEALWSNIPTDSCQVTTDVPECFICKDAELVASDPLRNFCDCKTMVAHHVCLSTWIKRGQGSLDRLRCIACKAEYQLRWDSPWWSLSCQWQTWAVLIVAAALLSLVPYVVNCLMTMKNPPPQTTFKMAAVCFGILTVSLLIKCLSSYLTSQYRQAEQCSFTVQARGLEEREVCFWSSPWWWRRHPAPAVATAGREEDRKPGMVV